MELIHAVRSCSYCILATCKLYSCRDWICKKSTFIYPLIKFCPFSTVSFCHNLAANPQPLSEYLVLNPLSFSHSARHGQPPLNGVGLPVSASKPHVHQLTQLPSTCSLTHVPWLLLQSFSRTPPSTFHFSAACQTFLSTNTAASHRC